MPEITLAPRVIAEEAQRLFRAERMRTAVSPLTERIPGLTVDDAYAIQREGIALRAAAGATIVGHKVGLTSLAMQELLGVHQPDYGVLLDAMIIDASAGLRTSELVAPRIEAEIAFVLDAPVGGPDVTVDQVLAATGQVRAALEVIDSRIADWKIAIEDTIADNASSAAVVLGAPVPVAEVDLVAETVTVTAGDKRVDGNGSAVLGHPAEAVAWLARTLARHGESLRAGQVVLPGAMAAALPLEAGSVVEASFSTLGALRVDVG